MTSTEAAKKIEVLKKKISDADYKYYTLASPDIDDYKYDLMMKELEKLEKEFPELRTDDSPTNRVSGEPTKSFGTIQHQIPMLSLSNTYNFDELVEFDNRIKNILEDRKYEYVCELKFDGIAISLIYKNRKLVTGATRGDGVR
ncbi:MAG: hypothetical protein R2942_08050 [Ignavibacteria bacterium]